MTAKTFEFKLKGPRLNKSQQTSMVVKQSFIVTAGAWLTGVGLVLLGLQCFVFAGAAKGYGVFPVDENGFAYLLATGMRDVSLGLVTLYLLLRFRGALAVYFGLLVIIPIADSLIVWNYGDSSLSLGVHLVGVVGLSALSWFAFQEQQKSRANSRPIA